MIRSLLWIQNANTWRGAGIQVVLQLHKIRIQADMLNVSDGVGCYRNKNPDVPYDYLTSKSPIQFWA